MAGKPSFEEVLSKRKPANEEPKGPKRSRGGTSTLKPSRTGTKHIGGHFPPEVAKQLRQLAVDEDTSHQKLLGEALDLLFQTTSPHDRQQIIVYQCVYLSCLGRPLWATRINRS